MATLVPAASTLERGESDPGVDSILKSRDYDPRDFAYFEDAARRCTGIAVFGAILFVGAAYASLVPPFVYHTTQAPNVVLGFEGLLVIFVLVGALYVVVHAEAAMGALAGGATLIAAAAGLDSEYGGAGGHQILITISALGLVVLLTGAFFAARFWRRSRVDPVS
jgi:hypothetical protein